MQGLNQFRKTTPPLKKVDYKDSDCFGWAFFCYAGGPM